MRRAPAFWADTGSRLGRALSPLGAVYGAATARRLAGGRPWRAPVPVICVGNVTAGGSGKTPVVQALVRRALARGVAVHCLSRGYGGKARGPVRVGADTDSAASVGDEPLLLARLAPTWVASDRAAAARRAVEAGAQLLILDDGLQNPALAYDLSLLVIDGGFGFGNGRMIPAGPLRESVAAAAARCGAAVLIGGDEHGSLARLPATLPVVRARIVPTATTLAGCKVVAFAGLGRPEKFRRTLAETGADIVAWFPFPDHHTYSEADIERLTRAAAANAAQLVTTDKDRVRLKSPLPPGEGIMALEVELLPDEPDAFDRLLDRVLR